MSEQRISSLLLELGVPAHLLGYGYLLEAVQIAGERPETLRKVTKELYPMVAQWCSDPETQQKYFGASVNPESGRPTMRST